ncbi:MAG: MATE family efflux transporter [Phycisphaerales bacterium]|nr:MATE family efflux transporter [Phycisphaerales bacterium]
MSEARRGLIRVTTNYGRLMATLVIGVILTRVQLEWVGIDGFALIAAIIASSGLAAMFQDIMRFSMVRELGTVWHDMNASGHDEESERHFRRVYASSFVLCGLIALLSAIVFALFLWLVSDSIWPFDTLAAEYRTAAKWMLVAEGVKTCLLILLAPAFNMYVVMERFPENNLWLTLNRLTYLISALVLFAVLGSDQIELSLILYGVSVAVLLMLILLVAVGRIMLGDPRLRPNLRLADRGAFREIIGTFGWNSTVITAMNLHERVGALIMLGFFGLWGSGIFSLAMRLVSYVRMLTLGVTFGLDAVSARLSSSENITAFRSVVRLSTRLNAYISIPAAITVFLLAEPLLELWVGQAANEPDPMTGRGFISATAVLTRIMIIGMLSRAISDVWMRMLYGAGHIKRYAPMILAGGIANPIIACLLITWMPPSMNWMGAALSFSAVLFVVHLIMLPVTNARYLEMNWQDLLGSLCRPAVLAAIPAALYAIVLLWTQPAPWWVVFPICIVYAVAYGGLGYVFGLEPQERKQIYAMIARVRNRQTQ